MRPIARWLARKGFASLACLGVLGPWTGAEAQAINNSLRSGTEPPCVLDKCLNPDRSTRGADRDDSPGSGIPGLPNTDRDNPGSGGFTGTSPAPGSFDFYVLALSWSPGFCETGGAGKARAQCESGARLGFVVHGLWPQNQRGYPSDCDSNLGFPSRMALDSVRGLYPDEGLARHEWRKHGTCTGKSPTAYFADVRRARAAVVIPDPFQAPSDGSSWAPLDIARAFRTSNPRLKTDSIAVTCRQNKLAEVRICLGKDLRDFVSCPEVVRASCRRPVEVPPVL